MGEFEVKDSGQRTIFESGMKRDTDEGKINYALVADGPMLHRWAVHLTKGAQKYEKRNWMKANGEAELERAKESAFRHFIEWFLDEPTGEDKAAGVFFNINQVEYIKEKLRNGTQRNGSNPGSIRTEGCGLCRVGEHCSTPQCIRYAGPTAGNAISTHAPTLHCSGDDKGSTGT